ncbi:MAG: nucleoside-diphosphate kinase [Actinomycetales bacterium]|nr:MAG: nucleoside-diphosphate kinase [Actinomycetales bacterium]
MTNRTLVIIKPDAVSRGLIGAILQRYESKGLEIVAMEQRMVSVELSDAHYAEHVEKDFYPNLRQFITSGPAVALVLAGRDVISVVRAMHGASDPVAAAPGTIRGDFGLDKTQNLVHGSDSEESAVREITLWFPGLA